MPKGTEHQPTNGQAANHTSSLKPTHWEIIRATLNHEGESTPAELHAQIRTVHITQTMDMTRQLLGILVKNKMIRRVQWGVYANVNKPSDRTITNTPATTAPPEPVKAPEPQARATQPAPEQPTEPQVKPPTDPEEKFFIIAEAAGGPIKITYTGSIKVEFLP